MHDQSTFSQPRCNRLHHFSRLLLTVAVHHPIIGIARKPALWIPSFHPDVKRIMHEQIHQDRGNYPALWSTALSWHLLSFGGLKRNSQPAFEIQQYPTFLDVGAHSL